MLTSARQPLLDPYLPLQGAFWAARRLGFSAAIARHLSRYITSPRRIERCFRGVEPTARDVFVATFLKSGTNWMMQMALQTAYLGKADFAHVHDVIPWPDQPGSHAIGMEDPRGWSAPTGLRIIKTHGDAPEVPYAPEATYLVVLRDPKEVLVSAYHFATALMGIAGEITPQEWLDILFESEDQIGSNPWLRHTLSWWALRDRPNVHILNYGEMKRDRPGTVARVAEAMGVTLEGDALEAVIERSGLPYMKAHEACFRPKGLPFVRASHIPKMVRRGVSGGAEELYSREDLARIDRAILGELERQGSDFPYRDLFEVVA